MLEMMPHFQIFFYTAGIRNYGKLIMEVIKHHCLDSENIPDNLRPVIEQTFRPERLIARDDNERYVSQLERVMNSNNLQNNMGGGDATLKLNIFKSLKALAGDNDSIFVILDDRDDVWMNDLGQLPQNLLKIPPYFFHDTPGVTSRLQSFAKLFFDLNKYCDLDMALVTFKEYLLQVHSNFYRNFDKKKGNKQLTDIKYYL